MSEEIREWVVYRTRTNMTVYTGIQAESRDEAIAAFLRGDGEQQPDRERWSEWEIDAVSVR